MQRRQLLGGFSLVGCLALEAVVRGVCSMLDTGVNVCVQPASCHRLAGQALFNAVVVRFINADCSRLGQKKSRNKTMNMLTLQRCGPAY